ncbi:MAG: hypothetical protein ACJA2F_001026, partial [Nitriliruptoraceae bacterium]
MNIDMLETTSGSESIAVANVLAAARGESELVDRDGLRTLLQRATGRGYVLASELH